MGCKGSSNCPNPSLPTLPCNLQGLHIDNSWSERAAKAPPSPSPPPQPTTTFLEGNGEGSSSSWSLERGHTFFGFWNTELVSLQHRVMLKIQQKRVTLRLANKPSEIQNNHRHHQRHQALGRRHVPSIWRNTEGCLSHRMLPHSGRRASWDYGVESTTAEARTRFRRHSAPRIRKSLKEGMPALVKEKQKCPRRTERERACQAEGEVMCTARQIRGRRTSSKKHHERGTGGAQDGTGGGMEGERRRGCRERLGSVQNMSW